jgi:4-hydroxy-tetrahydrodipicolinate reductase
MKIALIGYGKMGKTIEKIAQQRGHEIVLRISSTNPQDFTENNLLRADIAIEFTKPESALENVTRCMNAGIPVVCGSTGWDKKVYLAKEKCISTQTAFLQASNFSIGVNIFFEINKRLASLMSEWPEYSSAIEEIHHTEKKDAPSGTAITLANEILDNHTQYKHWQLQEAVPIDSDIIPIKAVRTENVPGTHTVTYTSAIDSIEIKHTAFSRDGFAQGAVLAAEFIVRRKGVFSMSDVLKGSLL